MGPQTGLAPPRFPAARSARRSPLQLNEQYAWRSLLLWFSCCPLTRSRNRPDPITPPSRRHAQSVVDIRGVGLTGAPASLATIRPGLVDLTRAQLARSQVPRNLWKIVMTSATWSKRGDA